MRQIKSFGVLQTSKVLGAVYFVFGLLFAAIMIAFSMARVPQRGHHLRGGLFLIVLVPLLYGVAGAIFTAIICGLYNAVAKRLGGIEFELSGEP